SCRFRLLKQIHPNVKLPDRPVKSETLLAAQQPNKIGSSSLPHRSRIGYSQHANPATGFPLDPVSLPNPLLRRHLVPCRHIDSACFAGPRPDFGTDCHRSNGLGRENRLVTIVRVKQPDSRRQSRTARRWFLMALIPQHRSHTTFLAELCQKCPWRIRCERHCRETQVNFAANGNRRLAWDQRKCCARPVH